MKWPLLKNNWGFPSANGMFKSLGDPSETPRGNILTIPHHTIIFHPGKFGNKKREIVHMFFISNSIFGVKVRVSCQIYVFNAKSCFGVG